MSGWILVGVLLSVFIAGFNIGQDCKYKKGIFKRRKKYKYFLCCMFTEDNEWKLGSWVFEFDEKMNQKQLEKFRKEQENALKERFEDNNVLFTVVDFKRLED